LQLYWKNQSILTGSDEQYQLDIFEKSGPGLGRVYLTLNIEE